MKLAISSWSQFFSITRQTIHSEELVKDIYLAEVVIVIVGPRIEGIGLYSGGSFLKQFYRRKVGKALTGDERGTRFWFGSTSRLHSHDKENFLDPFLLILK